MFFFSGSLRSLPTSACYLPKRHPKPTNKQPIPMAFSAAVIASPGFVPFVTYPLEAKDLNLKKSPKGGRGPWIRWMLVVDLERFSKKRTVAFFLGELVFFFKGAFFVGCFAAFFVESVHFLSAVTEIFGKISCNLWSLLCRKWSIIDRCSQRQKHFTPFPLLSFIKKQHGKGKLPAFLDI